VNLKSLLEPNLSLNLWIPLHEMIMKMFSEEFFFN